MKKHFWTETFPIYAFSVALVLTLIGVLFQQIHEALVTLKPKHETIIQH